MSHLHLSFVAVSSRYCNMPSNLFRSLLFSIMAALPPIHLRFHVCWVKHALFVELAVGAPKHGIGKGLFRYCWSPYVQRSCHFADVSEDKAHTHYFLLCGSVCYQTRKERCHFHCYDRPCLVVNVLPEQTSVVPCDRCAKVWVRISRGCGGHGLLWCVHRYVTCVFVLAFVFSEHVVRCKFNVDIIETDHICFNIWLGWMSHVVKTKTMFACGGNCMSRR